MSVIKKLLGPGESIKDLILIDLTNRKLEKILGMDKLFNDLVVVAGFEDDPKPYRIVFKKDFNLAFPQEMIKWYEEHWQMELASVEEDEEYDEKKAVADLEEELRSMPNLEPLDDRKLEKIDPKKEVVGPVEPLERWVDLKKNQPECQKKAILIPMKRRGRPRGSRNKPPEPQDRLLNILKNGNSKCPATRKKSMMKMGIETNVPPTSSVPVQMAVTMSNVPLKNGLTINVPPEDAVRGSFPELKKDPKDCPFIKPPPTALNLEKRITPAPPPKVVPKVIELSPEIKITIGEIQEPRGGKDCPFIKAPPTALNQEKRVTSAFAPPPKVTPAPPPIPVVPKVIELSSEIKIPVGEIQEPPGEPKSADEETQEETEPETESESDEEMVEILTSFEQNEFNFDSDSEDELGRESLWK